MQDYVAQKTARLRDLEKRLGGFAGFNHRQQALLAHALRKQGAFYTVSSHRDSHRISSQTARTDLDALVSRGLLATGKRGRAVTYQATGDLGEHLSEAK